MASRILEIHCLGLHPFNPRPARSRWPLDNCRHSKSLMLKRLILALLLTATATVTVGVIVRPTIAAEFPHNPD